MDEHTYTYTVEIVIDELAGSDDEYQKIIKIDDCQSRRSVLR